MLNEINAKVRAGPRGGCECEDTQQMVQTLRKDTQTDGVA